MARVIDGTEMNLVGYNIRKYRKSQKLSQKRLSEKLETHAIYVCRGSISRIEKKQRTVTDIELYGIASILNISINDLFE